MKTFQFDVHPSHGGMRLDQYLAARLADAKVEISRRKIRQAIDAGAVTVNGKRVRIASREVVRQDKIKLEYSEVGLQAVRRQDFSLKAEDILLDRDDVIAINKPAGLLAQGTLDATLPHAASVAETYFAAHGKKGRKLILVHRLDKETSGILLLADSALRATWLTDRFRDRTVKKVYWAVCYGKLTAGATFTEKAPLSEIDKKTGNVRAVRAGGRQAVTHFTVLAVNPALNVGLVECRPETGRSHQIRVHLEVQGFPIVGDKRYGEGRRTPLPPELLELSAAHHLLHAKELSFVPGEGLAAVSLKAPLPPRFRDFLAAAPIQSEAIKEKTE